MYRVFAILLLVSTSFPALATPPAIKVMSFNIRYDGSKGKKSSQANAWLGKSGEHRHDIAMQVINDYGPDILGVQEAVKNQVADLQANLPSHSLYAVGRDDGMQQGEHCAILFRSNRFSAIKQGTFWLNKSSDQPGTRFPKTCCARIASWVILQDQAAGNQEYLVINTHWDNSIQEARLFSAQLIRRFAPALAGGRPLLFMGDLNAKPDNPAFRALVSADKPSGLALLDSYREAHPQPSPDEATYHAFDGHTNGARIDYLLHSDTFRTTAAQIVRTHKGQRYPSDHFAVTATLIPPTKK